MDRITTLRTTIDKAATAYYRTGKAIMTDADYDPLIRELRGLDLRGFAPFFTRDTRYLKPSRTVRCIAWGTQDRGWDPDGTQSVSRFHIWPDTPSLRELVAATAPLGSQDPRSKPNLRPGLRQRYRMSDDYPVSNYP